MIRPLACLTSGIGCLTAAGWLTLGGWMPSPAEAVTEELVVTPSVHDFGTVGQNETLPAEFTVTNNYRRPVHIVEVTKLCSCVQPTLAKTDLAPGESTTVQVGWRTHGKRGRAGDTLGIQCQVGTEFIVRNFRLAADVVPDVTTTPERVWFGGDRPRQQVVTLSPRNPAADVRIVSAHCSVEAVTATPGEDGRSVILKFDPAGSVTPDLAHRLLIKLSGIDQLWLEVPVSVEATHPH